MLSVSLRAKAFAGVVKRHGFAGGPKPTDKTDRHRAPGAIGATTFARWVLKGLRMAAIWANEQVTQKGLKFTN